MTDPFVAEALVKIDELLAKRAVREAVAYVNSLTDHRFTSLYRFTDETLQNLYFFDRQFPEEVRTDDVPLLYSYCVFVKNEKRKFVVQSSKKEPRLKGHPKQKEVPTYCGIPLVSSDGKMYGTLCHFDYEEKELLPRDIELLEHFAPMLQKHLGL